VPAGRPGAGRAAGVYSCKFRKQKYIFVQNDIEKYKNKKRAAQATQTESRSSSAQAGAQAQLKPALGLPAERAGGFFIFIFFISIFYKNIFSIWNFTEIYPGRTAAVRPEPGRPAAGRQGLIHKKQDEKKLQTGPWGPVTRQRGGRHPNPI
jgi:hypothetical protein